MGPGTKLGRYELLAAIARGGMAIVWAARPSGPLDKLVAVKTILPELAGDPSFQRMFVDEARLAARVEHPNVCATLELGEEQGTLFLAMEWVNGDSLARILRPAAGGEPEPLDPRVAARILADAAAGLHAAHETVDEHGRPLGVVHRDVSPHNFLVSLDGAVKVCDFGVAKAFGQVQEQTRAGQIKGKISYMAPEQIAGSAIDRRCDVFALGSVLYEATTGVKPFRAENDVATMHRILAGQYAPPEQLVPGFPAELAAILRHALEVDPARRIPTADAFRAALEGWLGRVGAASMGSAVAHVVRQRIGPIVNERRGAVRAAQGAHPLPHGVLGTGLVPSPDLSGIQRAPQAAASGPAIVVHGASGSGSIAAVATSAPHLASGPHLPVAADGLDPTLTKQAYAKAVMLGLVGATLLGSAIFLGIHSASPAAATQGASPATSAPSATTAAPTIPTPPPEAPPPPVVVPPPASPADVAPPASAAPETPASASASAAPPPTPAPRPAATPAPTPAPAATARPRPVERPAPPAAPRPVERPSPAATSKPAGKGGALPPNPF